MSDLAAYLGAARHKRLQLEKEIYDSSCPAREKSNMVHTLSKLWIFVDELYDAAERASKKGAPPPISEGKP